MDFRGTTEELVTETLLPSCVSGSFAESFWFPPTTVDGYIQLEESL